MNAPNRPPGHMVIDDRKVGGKRRKRKGLRALIWILVILVLALIAAVVFVWSDVSKVWSDLGFDPNAIVEDDEPEPDAGHLPEVTFNQGNVSTVEKPAGVTDIMLVGVDTRDESKFTGRSDVLMIVRVDTNTNEVKLVSFMRDTLVAIDGHDKNRINTAYHYGSIDLAYDTLIDNFGISPDHYMVINFYGMEDVINAMDGVDVHIESNEVSHVNDAIRELNAHDPDHAASMIDGEGMTHLNGRQAVAYMRVRKVGYDSGRISRQQEVLQALFSKATQVDAGQIPGLIDTMSDYVRTDIPLGKMVDLAGALRAMQGSELNTLRYPQDYENGRYNDRAIVLPKDVDAELQQLHGFLE